MAYNVLVVEDDEPFRMLVCEALESLGLAVHGWACAEEAIQRLEEATCTDLVVTDIQMPGKLDGIDLANIIDKRWPSNTVIVTSGGLQNHACRLPGAASFSRSPRR